MVLDILKQHNLTAATGKCHFFKTEVLFLGHIVSADGVKVDPAIQQRHLQSVSKLLLPELRCVCKLRSSGRKHMLIHTEER
jgi:hypothetical protein